MSFVKKTANDFGRLYESYTLPDTVQEFSSEISQIKPRLDGTVQNVGFALKASAVTGTNLDIAIYGALTSGGIKFLLKDAIVADITDATKVVGYLDVNTYPCAYYYVAWTADADESANTIELEVFGQLQGSKNSF